MDCMTEVVAAYAGMGPPSSSSALIPDYEKRKDAKTQRIEWCPGYDNAPHLTEKRGWFADGAAKGPGWSLAVPGFHWTERTGLNVVRLGGRGTTLCRATRRGGWRACVEGAAGL